MHLLRSVDLQGWQPHEYVLNLVQNTIAGRLSVLPPPAHEAQQIAEAA